MLFKDIVSEVKKGKISVYQRVDEYLKRIEKNKNLNAFISVFDEQSRLKAQELDERIKQGAKTGNLSGLVIAIKDNIVIKNEKTTCSSTLLKSFQSPYSATVVKKLIEADAIIIGKTNLDEFAMGSSNENSIFGPVKNPYNEECVPGGSSGGSAVAVAAKLADAALGSETGGSIRQPASFTYTVGIKPSYGRVSRYGLVAFASSLDQVGVFANKTLDAAKILKEIAGFDESDSTSAEIDVPDYESLTDFSVKGLKVAIPREYFASGLDSEIKQQIESKIGFLKNNGAIVNEISMPMFEYAVAIYYILATAEASSNLARYDGVRYTTREGEKEGLHEMYAATRSAGFGDEVRRRIILGTYVLSSGYYDAYYKKAQQVRRLLKEEFDKVFTENDLIISPTTPTTAFKIGEKSSDPLEMYLSDIYTVSANLAGICALNIPCGFHSNGMPFGMQLQAKAFNEHLLFKTGHFLEPKVD